MLVKPCYALGGGNINFDIEKKVKWELAKAAEVQI